MSVFFVSHILSARSLFPRTKHIHQEFESGVVVTSLPKHGHLSCQLLPLLLGPWRQAVGIARPVRGGVLLLLP